MYKTKNSYEKEDEQEGDMVTNLYSFDEDYSQTIQWRYAKGTMGLSAALKKEHERTVGLLKTKNTFKGIDIENHITLPDGTDLFPLFRTKNDYRGHMMINEAMHDQETVLHEQTERYISGYESVGRNSYICLKNKSGIPVFCLAGTVLLGGLQNRIIIEPFMADAYCNYDIDNFHCVEPKRWSRDHRKGGFELSDRLPASYIRNRWFTQDSKHIFKRGSARIAGSGYQVAHQIKPAIGKREIELFEEISQVLGQEDCCGYIKKNNEKTVALELFQYPEDFKAVHVDFAHALAMETLRQLTTANTQLPEPVFHTANPESLIDSML